MAAIAQTARDRVVAGATGAAPRRVLVAARNLRGHEEFILILKRHGLDPVSSSTIAESRELLRRETISLVLCEDEVADGNYEEILRDVGGFATRIPVVVFSRLADWDRYLKAMRAGAFDYLPDPCSPAEIQSVVHRALGTAPLFP